MTHMNLESILPRGEPQRMYRPVGNVEIYSLAAKLGDGDIIMDRHGKEDYAHLPSIEDAVGRYMQKEGKNFVDYLAKQGKKPVIHGIGSGNLGENTVAAIAKSDDITLLLADRDFEGKVGRMAKEYGLSEDDAKMYVLTHEFAHAAGVEKETDVEKLLAVYFTERSQDQKGKDPQRQHQYHRLAKLAEYRSKQGEDTLKGRAEKKVYIPA